MNYLHETISEPDQKKIVHDASPKFSRLYAARRGYFEERVMFPVWVVDRQEDSYLLSAPILGVQKEFPILHFYFKGEMYHVELHGDVLEDVHLVAPVAPEMKGEFESALIAALLAHGPHGFPLPLAEYRVRRRSAEP